MAGIGRGWRDAVPPGVAMLTCVLAISGPAFATENLARGRALAERLCAQCHMAPGQGEKRAANEIPGFAAVAARRHQTHEGIVAWLRSIPPMMPNHHLTQDEMHALADFILSMKPQSMILGPPNRRP